MTGGIQISETAEESEQEPAKHATGSLAVKVVRKPDPINVAATKMQVLAMAKRVFDAKEYLSLVSLPPPKDLLRQRIGVQSKQAAL